jgi:hypothetical protein
VANHSGSSRDIPASCSQQSLGRTNRYLEILRQQNAPETAFLQKVSDLLLEFMLANLLTRATEKNDQNFEEFRRKVLALVAENEADAAKISWVARLIEPRRRH